jgi:hypothetical protein
VENTALSGYWYRGEGPALCSECDPKIGKWHKKFKKQNYKEAGYKENMDGFLE